MKVSASADSDFHFLQQLFQIGTIKPQFISEEMR